MGNAFVRLDPGVYSPTELEIEIAKVYDIVTTVDNTIRYPVSSDKYLNQRNCSPLELSMASTTN